MSRKINLSKIGFFDKQNLPNSQLDQTFMNAIPCLHAKVKYALLKQVDPIVDTYILYQQ